MDEFYCSFSTPTIVHFFDVGFAPTLLWYSYIPIILLSLFLGVFIYFKDKHSLQSKLLLSIAFLFAIWSITQIVQWIAVYARVVHFGWEIISVIEILIPIFAIYFTYVFLNKRDMPFGGKLALSVFFLPVVLALPTIFNMISFDVTECQANNGIIWFYIYYLLDK